MNDREVTKKLNSLIQLDIDAIRAYDQALGGIDAEDEDIRDALEEYRGDHERHIQVLSGIVRDFGGEPPERSPDFQGFLLQGFTAIRSATGTEGALKAMERNERITNDKYNDARSWDLGAEIQEVIEGNFMDEQTHLEFIEEALGR
jgi:uncharacterized protein (TIGR02284 family)